MNKIPNGTDVIGKLLRERERVTDEPAAALAKGIVEPLDVVGFATLLTHRTMAFGR